MIDAYNFTEKSLTCLRDNLYLLFCKPNRRVTQNKRVYLFSATLRCVQSVYHAQILRQYRHVICISHAIFRRGKENGSDSTSVKVGISVYTSI